MSAGSTTRHTIEIFYKVTGLDQGAAGVNTFNTSLNQNAKAADSSGKSVGNLTKTNKQYGTSSKQTTTQVKTQADTFGKLDVSVNKSSKSIQSGVKMTRGLAFGMIGLITSGVEAIGMLSMYTTALDDLNEAKQRVIELEKAGMEGTQEYARALDAANDSQRGFNFLQRNMILSMFDLVPFIVLTINALSKMGQTQKITAAATSVLTAALTKLGVVKTVTTDFASFWTLQEAGPPKLTKLSTAFTALGDKFKLLPTSLKNVGKSFTDFFGGISLEMKKTDGVLNKSKAGFASFAASAGGVFSKIGAGFKAAGAAALAFGRTLLGVFMSNPILLVLTAISVAITALIFDFGGFRSRLNEVGVALGKAVPQLKFILTPMGQLGEILGSLPDRLTGVDRGLDKTSNSLKNMKTNADFTYEALKKVFDLSKENALETLTHHIENVSKFMKQFSTDMTNAGQVAKMLQTELTNSFLYIKNPTDTMKQAFSDAVKVLAQVIATGKITDDQIKTLTSSINALTGETAGEVAVTKESVIELHNANTAYSEQEAWLELVKMKVKQLSEEKKKDNEVTDQSLQNVAEWISKYSDANSITVEMSKGLRNASNWILLFGKNVRFTASSAVDMTKSLAGWKQEQIELEKSAKKVFNQIKMMIDDDIVSMDEADKMVQTMSKSMGAAGPIFEKMWDLFKTGVEDAKEKLTEMIDTAVDGAETVIDSQDNIIKELQRYRAEVELNKNFHNLFTADILADDEKLAAKIIEVTLEYRKYGLTSDDVKSIVLKNLDDMGKQFKKVGEDSELAAKTFYQSWDDAVSKVKDNFASLDSAVKSSQSSLADILTMKKKDRSKEDKKRLSGLDLSGDEKDTLEWVGELEAKLTKFSDFITTGKFSSAADFLTHAFDDAPPQYEGNFKGVNEILKKAGVESQGMAEIFGSSVEDMDMRSRAALQRITAEFGTDMFKTFRVGIHDVSLESAKLSATLDEKVAAALVGVKDSAAVGKAEWDKFYGSLSKSQQELPVMQDILKGLELGLYNNADGTVNWAKALGEASAAGQQASEQVGHMTQSLSSLNTKTVEVGNGMSATFANIGGQWVKVADNIKVGADGTVEKFGEVGTATETLAGQAENNLAGLTVDSINVLTDTTGTSKQTIVDNANFVIAIWKAMSNYAQSVFQTQIPSYFAKSAKDFLAFQKGVKLYSDKIEVDFKDTETKIKTNMTNIDKAVAATAKAIQKLDTDGKKAMSSLKSAISSMSKSAVSDFNKMASAADKARKALQALAKAKSSSGGGSAKRLQHGGMFVTDRQQRIGGNIIGEYGKPELVTVTPLSNPNDINDKSIRSDIGYNIESVKDNIKNNMAQMVSSAGQSSGSNNGNGGSMPTNIHVDVMLPSGEIIARAVKPFLLKQYSSVV